MDEFSTWFGDLARQLDRRITCRQFQRVCHYAHTLCESPIEARLLGSLALFDSALDDGFPFVGTLSECVDRQVLGDWDSYVIPQFKMDKLGYRLDFFISFASDAGWVNFAVESDGHDFHEKTKAQAARDKKRDRDIQTAGIPIIHFTGSEIFNDILSCHTQIHEFAKSLVSGRISADG